MDTPSPTPGVICNRWGKILTEDELKQLMHENSVKISKEKIQEDVGPVDQSEDEIDDEEQANTLTDGGKDIFWFVDPQVTSNITFTGNAGLRVPNPGNNPFGYFTLLANESMLNFILQETNIYGKQRSTEKWVEVSMEEFQTFLGVVYLMGIVNVPTIPQYWSKNDLYDFPVFTRAISRDRFLTIFRALHFGRNPLPGEPKPGDPLYKIRNIEETFRNNMTNIYYPKKELSLDESMVMWRGRLYFRQYVQNKSHKYDVKIYMLSEPDGLVLNNLIYTESRDKELGGIGHTEKVVKKLLSDYEDVGHAVYMDNYYNSPNLSLELLKKEIFSTGKLRSTRRGVPMDVKAVKLMKGECISCYSKEGLSVTKWKHRILSTEFGGEVVNVANKGEQEETKPVQAIQYHRFMGGIDKADQLLSYYYVERRTLRWNIRVGLHFLELSLLNAYLLYNRFSGSKMSLLQFREDIIRKLMKTDSLVTQKVKRKSTEAIHLPKLIKGDSKGKGKRRKCKVCLHYKTRKDVSFQCTMCPDEPALCLEPCFRTYHNY